MLRDRFKRGAESARERAANTGRRIREEVSEADVREKLRAAGERINDTAESREERSLRGAEESAHAAPVMDATLDPLTSPEDVHNTVGGGTQSPMAVDELLYSSGDSEAEGMTGIEVDSAFFGNGWGDEDEEHDESGVFEF